jgi:ankyrin repeat protein
MIDWNVKLLRASRTGNVKAIDIALEHGADINYFFNNKLFYGNCLNAADNNNKFDIVELLIKKGADVRSPPNTLISHVQFYSFYKFELVKLFYRYDLIREDEKEMVKKTLMYYAGFGVSTIGQKKIDELKNIERLTKLKKLQ